MIFHELHSAYYNAVAAVLSLALKGETNGRALWDVALEKAFGESSLTLLPALREGRWQLLTPSLATPIRHAPTMPLTLLEKRWLRAIADDPRVRLFDVDLSFLSDVEPLFTAADYRVYDRYADGDPYEDEDYVERFRTALDAVKNGTPLTVEMRAGSGRRISMHGVPSHIEYSEKDDKMRLYFSLSDGAGVVNLGRVSRCRPYTGDRKMRPVSPPRSRMAVFTVNEERNAHERVLLHFAHFEKRVVRVSKECLRVCLKYDREDEGELVTRVLSFGPMIRVEEPDGLLLALKERLVRQMRCPLS